MIIIADGKKIDVSKLSGFSAEDFDPDQIFDCGQCFRWSRNEDGIWESPEKVETPEEYFDLKRDYGRIKEYLIGGGLSSAGQGYPVGGLSSAGQGYSAGGDGVMAEAIACGSGIRILNQPKWETLVSFIISQNNNIPRIRKCILSLSELFGGFPSADQLAGASIEDLKPCHLGYRDRYLIEAARQIRQEPGLLQQLASPNVSADEAVGELQRISGVGPKVASCVALFSLGKVDSFPIDVWIKRVMHQMYGIPENDLKAMKRYAEEHFAPYGGIAQQYLFYYFTHKRC